MKVSIIVLTYNQEKTIKRTLDSILDQQTNHSYEIVIGDDDSKDGTRQICESYVEQYPGKIILNSKHDNYGVVKNFVETYRQCTGEYIMGCAGDDWWSDPKKIDVQVDYMDKNPDCVVLHGGFYEYHVLTGEKIYKRPLKIYGDQFVSVLHRNPVCAPSLCIRKHALDKINVSSYLDLCFMVEDYPNWLALSTEGDICCLDQALVTYSIYPGSIHNIRDYGKRIDYIDNFNKMRLYFAEKNGRIEELRDEISDIYYTQRAETAIQYGVRKDAEEAYKKIINKDRKTRIKEIMVHIPLLFNLIHKRYNKGLHA